MHISLLLLPDIVASSVLGPLDLLRSAALLQPENSPPLHAELVAPSTIPYRCLHGITLGADRTLAEIQRTDVILIPSLTPEALTSSMVNELCDWICMHAAQGTRVASICTGAFLLAATGLLEGRRATTHWAFEQRFKTLYPRIKLESNTALLQQGNILMAGGGLIWQDLVLHLIEEWGGQSTALQLLQLFLLQEHREGQKPLSGFVPRGHQDLAIKDIERWLEQNFRESEAASRAIVISGLHRRTFQRRFQAATGLPVVQYLQHLRIEAAKLALRNSRLTVEEIGLSVGYLDTSSFRRLFRRRVGMSPKDYQMHFGRCQTGSVFG